ncbi:transmembrane protein 26-like [Diadema antillarum]|uniref:transmembrane protein 26-like n=1 Tax=Diadema antillarum TaxID=105358 RepID=UPI003A8888FE
MWKMRCEEKLSCSGVKVTQAIVTRLLFAAHNLIAIGRVAVVRGRTDSSCSWLLGLTLIGLAGETVFTLVRNKGEEMKWFCPSVLCFLAGSVPSIWILEFDLLRRRQSPEKARGDYFDSELENARTWVLALEQLLLFVLVVGRWLLPKGQITRDQLSQLLLVYIATAADIIEFFDSFNSDDSSFSFELITAVLTLWSWSLIQFTLVLTSTRGHPEYTSPAPPPGKEEKVNDDKINKWQRLAKMKAVVLVTGIPWPWGRFRQVVPLPNPPSRNRVIPVRPEDEDKVYPYNRCACLESEMWAVVVALLLQDGPFLVLRLILIFHHKVFTHLSVFFTCKNALVLMLQIYRLIVVHQEKKAADKERELERLRAEVLAAGGGRESDSSPDPVAERGHDPYETAAYQEAFQVLYRR